jgi:hypothetical protein
MPGGFQGYGRVYVEYLIYSHPECWQSFQLLYAFGFGIQQIILRKANLKGDCSLLREQLEYQKPTTIASFYRCTTFVTDGVLIPIFWDI